MPKITALRGPHLNLLANRETQHHGRETARIIIDPATFTRSRAALRDAGVTVRT